MKLSSRYALDLLFIVGGAALAVVAMGFAAPTAGWIGFGVFVGLMIIAAGSAIASRSTSRKIGHGLIGLVALWSLIATLTFSGVALTWLIFASAIFLGVCALGDLTAHEVTTENVVHRLEVTTAPADMSRSTSV